MKTTKYITLMLMSITPLLGAKDTCPLMVGEENDPEESVTVSGKNIGFCCGSCVSKFEDNKAYYIKTVKSLYEQFTAAERAAMGVDKVIVLAQKRCPIYPDRLINPNCPTVSYKNQTIFLWSSSAVRRWNRDPERYYQAAKASGILF